MMLENPPGDTSVLTTLFAHNTWANLKLLDFCERLSDEHLNTTAIGGFGSIRETLRHIVSGEVSYVKRVNGKLPARPLVPGQFPGFDVLRDAARWVGVELLQLALSAREDTVVQEQEPGQLVQYRLASLIAQALTHSTEHRTQIATIITQLGMEPPDMSGWQYMDEIGEIKVL
ncbi:MAG TPA: DinB family protein [Roseiflexaceae bacterium]|nr:DinB family protein [Roseiflexaceae bacterium]